MRSQWEDITPASAREALKTEQCGRPPSAVVVERYARDMEAGHWKRSPEPVVFAGEDTGVPVLRDGKQRHLAVILAGERLAARGEIEGTDDFSVSMWVTRGTTAEIEEAFPVMNTGKPRSGSDYLSTMGRDNGTLLYAMGRKITLWEHGKATGNSYKPTRLEVLEVLEPQPERNPAAEAARVELVEQAARYAVSWNAKPPLPPAAIAGFLWWLLGQADPEDRDVFLGYLRTGGGLTDQDRFAKDRHPVIILRNRLHGDYYEGRRRGTKVKQETMLFLCLRAWEAWRKGQDMKKLQMPTDLSDQHFRQPR
jgi:hypothetical protein